jgi:membrane-associated phospholipid phosphatase
MGPVPFIDNPVLRFLGQFAHRSEAFDLFILDFVKLDLFKGAVVIAILWWLWFSAGPRLRDHRVLVIQTVLGGAFAGLVSRILQSMLGRPRPVNGATDFVRLFGISEFDVDWMKHIHSFPSDHAAFFGAVAAGIFLANRRWGVFAFVWTLVVADLPRVYAGLHYPSDILAGLVLGVLTTLAMRKPAALLAGPVLRWEKMHAAAFYGVAFFALYEMARLFDEIRLFGVMVWRSAHIVLA